METNRYMKENRQPYQAPAVRETDIRSEACFLQSTSGGIDPWIEDDDSLNF